MGFSRRSKGTHKSSSAVIWCFVVWFTFRTVPLIYYRVARGRGEAVERKWERVRGFFPWVLIYYTIPTTHKATLSYLQNDADYPQVDESITQIPSISGIFQTVKGSLGDLVAYIGSSTELCWFVLLLSILAETGATTLSKYASENSSAGLLALACFMVILR
jgi:hypothetical protein